MFFPIGICELTAALRRNALPIGIVATTTVAVLCQFAQQTDPRFPLLYFTVDSSIFAAVVAIGTLVQPAHKHMEGLRLASTVAVVLSAVIFALVIAPASANGSWIQPHDDYWVRTATVLFHLVMPFLVTVDFLVHDPGGRPLHRNLLSCLAWPLLYFCAIAVLDSLGVAEIPYPFLDISQSNFKLVSASVAAVTLLTVTISSSLSLSRRLLRGGSN